jgi:DNA (cytosine-5)-methyltransferase 1
MTIINKRKKITVVDLFCGAGGLSLGFQKAGFKIVAAAENNVTYSKTHKLNFPSSKIYNGDIAAISPAKFSGIFDMKKNGIDVIIGGPPCQPFSNIGTPKINSLSKEGKKASDQRKYLFEPYLDYIEYFRPSMFLMENVPQLTTKENGKLFARIISRIELMGYVPSWTILNSVSYGVPQNRKRLFIVGVDASIKKINHSFYFPLPTHGDASDLTKQFTAQLDSKFNFSSLKKTSTVQDALEDLPKIYDGCREGDLPYLLNNALSEFQIAMRRSDGLVGGNVCRVSNERAKKIFLHMSPGQKYMDLPPKVRKILPFREDIFHDRLKRLDPRKPSWTVLAHIGMDGYMYIHPWENRTLSVREAARIQSFPDSFEFLGNMREQYIQVGNAVPPMLAEAIAYKIKQKLLGFSDE